MCAYVLQSWTASNEPVAETEPHVAIQVRGVGLVSWLLHLAGLTVTAGLEITGHDIKLSTRGAAGDHCDILPLEQLSSTRHGVSRPWRAAAAIAVVLGWIGYGAALRGHAWIGAGVVTLGCAAAVVLLLQGAAVSLRFVGVAGQQLELRFRPGNANGEAIGPAHAAWAADVAHVLADKRKSAFAREEVAAS